MEAVEDSIRALIYGNCIGDAIGLLSEFMSKYEAEKVYKDPLWHRKRLEYALKINDDHRCRWEQGDWTDDSDQMIHIMQSLLRHKQVNQVDFARRLLHWACHGFPELGDKGGCGIDATTLSVIKNPKYYDNPEQAAYDEWVKSERTVAPNGAVMRTSILGAFQFLKKHAVIENTIKICRVSHADPRCIASCVAVTTAIQQMLLAKMNGDAIDGIIVDRIIENSAKIGREQFRDTEIQWINEFDTYISVTNIRMLNLDEPDKIGYTLKCMGAGFWALRQEDFREALTDIVFEGGDADTNGAVAGALLGCKLDMKGLPKSWLYELKNKEWLDPQVEQFINLTHESNRGNAPGREAGRMKKSELHPKVHEHRSVVEKTDDKSKREHHNPHSHVHAKVDDQMETEALKVQRKGSNRHDAHTAAGNSGRSDTSHTTQHLPVAAPRHSGREPPIGKGSKGQRPPSFTATFTALSTDVESLPGGYKKGRSQSDKHKHGATNPSKQGLENLTEY